MSRGFLEEVAQEERMVNQNSCVVVAWLSETGSAAKTLVVTKIIHVGTLRICRSILEMSYYAVLLRNL